MDRKVVIIGAALVVVAGAGIAWWLLQDRGPKLKEVKASCSTYHGQTSTFSVRRTDTFEIPFYEEVVAWKANDDTDQIWVISQLGVPSEMPRYRLKAMVVDGEKLGADLVKGMEPGNARDILEWLLPHVTKVIDWLSDPCLLIEHERTEE